MADRIEELVAALAHQLKGERDRFSGPGEARKPAFPAELPATPPVARQAYTVSDYPMLEKHGGEIRTPTDKGMDDITLEGVMEGAVEIGDVRISPDMLRAQAEIAADAGKPALGENLLRAAELTQVPDDVIIGMYDKLRPNRSTGEELEELARTLTEEYGAPRCAALVREAAGVYRERGILRRE